ncbi:MAG TPA: Ig-like domain-containing protein, partial [Verrucomicrobiae bacterium]|nr:Ig-like domain-containing protein [Verrucomicrobiae bacterium]
MKVLKQCLAGVVGTLLVLALTASWSRGASIGVLAGGPSLAPGYDVAESPFCLSCAPTYSFIPLGAPWRYLDNGSDQGAAWRQTNFNDAAWASGIAQFGYGDGDESTLVNGGPSGSRYATIYFRNSFSVTNLASITNCALRLLRDDGAVVYLNGVEVFRGNMPDAPVTFNSWAAVSVSGSEENAFFAGPIPSALLVQGTNVMAVEVHQSDPGSSDLSFNLELIANTPLGNLPPVPAVSVSPATRIVASNETFLIHVSAFDPESSVSQISLYQDGMGIWTVLSNSIDFSSSNSILGIHDYTASAKDALGLVGLSPPARVLVTRPGFQGQSVFFPQFSSPNGLIVQNGATISSNVLHLTQSTAGSRGGVWLASQQNVLSGFVSEFRFRIISKVGGGGDGFCFNIAGTAQPNIGTSIGYSGITNCLSVEFDTYMNTSANDPDDHHISVHSRGPLGNSSDESASLGLVTPGADFSDGNVHKAKIEYAAGMLRVYLDNLTTPILSVNVDLSALLSLPNGYAWIGLAAGSGSSFEYHDISTWSYTSVANVPPLISLASPARAIRSTPGADLALLANAEASSGTIARVAFYDGSQYLGEAASPPFAFLWSNLPAGIHSITASALDGAGLSATSLPVVVEVLSSNVGVILLPDFAATTNLEVQGNTAILGNRLRLTPAINSQIGAAWLNARQSVEFGFETVFQFQVSQLGGSGADGLAFVIQNNSVPMLGSAGIGIGYGSIPNSLAVEFDTYQNSQAPDPDANHVSIHSLGIAPNSADESASLVTVSPVVQFSDGNV